MVIAGSTAGEVAAFDRRGRPLWTSKVGPVYRAAAVSAAKHTVYVPSTDHRLYALDARNGRRRWTFRATDPVLSWPLVTDIGGVECVLASAETPVAGVWRIDPATGADRWTRTGGFMYPPAVPVPVDSAALLLTETGALSLVDLADGTSRWDAALAVRVLNSGGGVLRGETLWVQSVDGQLIGVNVTDGTESARIQNGTAYCFATPVTMGNTVVVADQDGSARGISVE